MLAGTFAPLFPVSLAEKDFGYLLRTGATVAARLPAATTAHGVMADAIALGFGSDNITGIARLYPNEAA